MTPTPDIRVDLTGGFSVKQGRIERLIRLLEPVLALEEPAVVHVELERLVTVSPAALALLIGTLKHVSARGLIAEGSVINPPKSPAIRNYLLRMNLVRVLLGEDVDEPIARNPAEGFRPCEHFTDVNDYPTVALSLTEALTERCETDDVARASIRICLDEIAENVIHHAATATGGFAAAQGWRRNGEFEIAIVDLGIGIKASLTQNPEYADVTDDAQAIVRALQPHVSATPERNSGIGLFVTRLLLRANGGSLLVRSGYGAVYEGASDQVTLEQARMPGTLVALRARTDRPLNINAVYEQLDRDYPRHDADDDSD